MSKDLGCLATPRKRRRISQTEEDDHANTSGSGIGGGLTSRLGVALAHAVPAAELSHTDQEANIATISTDTKVADQTVAPFLAQHIPVQQTLPEASDQSHKVVPITKADDSKKSYCYRHRPGLNCRKQIDEPSMDQLQRELEALTQTDKQGIAHVWSLFSAAPAKQRKLMLQGILAQCCFPQLSYISASVRDLIRIDFLTAFPSEISFRVLCFLDPSSLCRAAQVSRRWRILADDDVIWHRMCEQHIDRKCNKCGWGLPLLERKRLRASKRQIQLRATGQGLNLWSPDITPFPETASESSSGSTNEEMDDLSTADSGIEDSAPAPKELAAAIESIHGDPIRQSHSDGVDDTGSPQRFRPWKEVYKDRFKVGTNWKYGRCTTKVFRGHRSPVMCLQFDGNILMTGSDDTTIKIWDIESGQEIRTLTGHTDGVRCLQFDDTKLISGSDDHSVKVWNWRTGECISTYNVHIDGILGLHLDCGLLASSSKDRTIKIWNFEGKFRCTLRGHTHWVNAAKVDAASRTVFSASDDFTVCLWDLDTQTCIKSFEGHVGQVQQVLPLPHEFDLEESEMDSEHDSGCSTTAAGGYNPSSPPAYDTTTGIPAEFPRDSYGDNFPPSRPLPPRYMLTSALDSTIRLWDTATQRCLRTYFGHVQGVWALAADMLRIVSGAEDRMVKVWDPRSGRCERTFTGHTAAVTCVGLSDERIATGSKDGEIRMYTF